MAALRHTSKARGRLAQRIFPLALAASCFTFGNAHAQSTLPEGVSATVNGEPVHTETVDTILKQFEANDQAADDTRILEEIINMHVLTQQAEKLELDQDPEVAAALKLQYVQTMANAYLTRLSEDIDIPDEDIRAMYDEQVAALEANEFRASHILLETKEEADKILKLLNDGSDFGELATEHSIDIVVDSGGDLGWFQQGDMVNEFYYAVKVMEVGAISEAPVKTEFGYHVIHLVDSRAAKAPDFESVKAGIVDLATRAKITEVMDNLVSEADIVR